MGDFLGLEEVGDVGGQVTGLSVGDSLGIYVGLYVGMSLGSFVWDLLGREEVGNVDIVLVGAVITGFSMRDLLV